MGVATGCGFKEIYRFPHTTYPYSSCICTFWQQHPYFCFHFVKMILRSFIYSNREHIHIATDILLKIIISCTFSWFAAFNLIPNMYH